VFAQAVLLLLDALSLPPLLLVVCSIWRVPTLVCATQIVLDTTSEGDSSHARAVKSFSAGLNLDVLKNSYNRMYL
jgi:hypothetical protein